MTQQDMQGSRREGVRVGALGATAAWTWMLVSDLLSRTPFSTPAFLGRSLLSVNAHGEHVSAVAGVVAFTIAHYAVWIGVGALLMAAVRQAARTPSILLGALVALILTQLLVVGITAILAQGPLGPAAWRDLMIGHAIACGAVVWYLLRAHPEIRSELAHASDEDAA